MGRSSDPQGMTGTSPTSHVLAHLRLQTQTVVSVVPDTRRKSRLRGARLGERPVASEGVRSHDDLDVILIVDVAGVR